MTDVRWGILGAGWLARTATAAAIHAADGSRLAVAAARDPERARALEPGRVVDDYRDLVEAPDVDAVYVCLANHQHLPWILAAIEAGKHVLCEKPLALSTADAERAFAAADDAGVLLVEAAWTRWHPRCRRIVELASSGALGSVTSFLGTFTFDTVPAGNYRLAPELGGGALYDVGIYPLHLLLACLPEVDEVQPVAVDRSVGGQGVDLTTKATLAWGEGTRATVVASFEMPASQRLVIRGAEVEVAVDDDEAFASWRVPTRLRVGERIEEFAAVDAYRLMVEQVSARIRGEEAWILPARDSLRVARAVDAIRSA